MIPGSIGIDGLTIDSVCVDEVNCASLASTFSTQVALKPKQMSTSVLMAGKQPASNMVVN